MNEVPILFGDIEGIDASESRGVVDQPSSRPTRSRMSRNIAMISGTLSRFARNNFRASGFRAVSRASALRLVVMDQNAAPSLASRIAMPRPIRFAAPVTSTTLPSRTQACQTVGSP